jgi:uncharacterized oxidoreductase
MKTTNNTVLVTGGSGGIGFEMAKLFSETGNNVIITGPDKEKMAQAISKLKNVRGIVSDVNVAGDVKNLATQLNKDFPKLNVVINNAESVSYRNIAETATSAFDNAREELTNYLSAIRLNELLLPRLKQQFESGIVNVSSIAVLVARTNSLPTYGASNVAIHSYTNRLRVMMEDTSVKIFELVAPLVHPGFPGKTDAANNSIVTEHIANDLLTGMKHDEFEIHAGHTGEIFNYFFAFQAVAARKRMKP